MSAKEYNTNSPYVNWCKMKGYEERIETEALMLRMASYRIHQSLVQKPLSIEKYWPLPSDKKDSVMIMMPTKEDLAKIKKAHNLK